MEGALDIGDEEFEQLVTDALDDIPDELLGLIDNAVVLVEAEPPEGEDVLGLYDGTPLTERDSWYTFREPDRIFIYRGPLLRMCTSREELVEEIGITVVHEIAHHFGIDDAKLHEWGWG